MLKPCQGSAVQLSTLHSHIPVRVCRALQRPSNTQVHRHKQMLWRQSATLMNSNKHEGPCGLRLTG